MYYMLCCRWSDITNLLNHKRIFGIECVRSDESVRFTLDDHDLAKYMWKVCVTQVVHTNTQFITYPHWKDFIICRIKWYHKIPDYEILERCQIFSLKSFLDKNKLRWTGHVIRMNDTRTPKILLYGRVDKGASKQGNHLSHLNSVKSLLREYQITRATCYKP